MYSWPIYTQKDNVICNSKNPFKKDRFSGLSHDNGKIRDWSGTDLLAKFLSGLHVNTANKVFFLFI